MTDQDEELDQAIQREADRQAREEGFNPDAPENNQGAGAPDPGKTEPEKADPAKQQAQPNQTFDVNKHFETISGGLFKTEDDFKTSLHKFSGYDDLVKERDALKAKAEENPFADDYEKRRNELKKGGASQEQLVAFEKVNGLGDLEKLEAIDAKVMKLVLVDGYPETVARRKVEKEFPINDEYADEDDLEILRTDLEISAKADRLALEEYKVEISTPTGDRILVDAASKEAIKAQLEPVLAEFNEKYSSIATLNLNGKEGDSAINFDVTADEATKQAFITDIRAFFADGTTPLTQENYDQALSYAQQNHVARNLEKIVQGAWARAEAHFTKFFTDKYENTGGLPKGDYKGTSQSAFSKSEEKAFKKELGVDLTTDN